MAGDRLAKLIAANQRAPYAKTAFDLAVENGFRGSVADWIESLKGARGAKGDRGEDGLNGKAGDPGPRGPQGPKGDMGPMPAHEWRGTELRFEIAPNEWGEFVDLKGEKGDKGDGGGGGAVLVTGNSYMPVGF